jgi:putative addiction module component (TIGR02574 family)
MSTNDLDRLFTEALSLPDDQRAALVTRLIDSLDQQVDQDAEAKWSDELERRIRDLDSGAVRPVGWPELRRRLMGRLNDSSAA